MFRRYSFVRLSMFLEIFRAFLCFGFTSFGGPIAHLGYFQNEFVVRRKWLSEQAFADLVALCQFLPGPTSSQVGFALGMLRDGLLGGCAAWLGFTLPSALTLIIFAYCAGSIDGTIGFAILHGLKIVAVAIVAQAVWSMARKLCPDWQRIVVALIAAGIAIGLVGVYTQIAIIVLGAISGLVLCRTETATIRGQLAVSLSSRAGLVALTVFFALLVGLPIANNLFHNQALDLANVFYRVGALVFGGGHVVLPLLQNEVVQKGWVDSNRFLAGYGVAQAIPGPLFTFAAYLGVVMQAPPNGISGALICLIAIFLPGMLLLIGMLPFWDRFRRLASAEAAMRGLNAAVVGLLGAALYKPLWISTIYTVSDMLFVLVGIALLVVWKIPSWGVVMFLVGSTTILAAI